MTTAREDLSPAPAPDAAFEAAIRAAHGLWAAAGCSPGRRTRMLPRSSYDRLRELELIKVDLPPSKAIVARYGSWNEAELLLDLELARSVASPPLPNPSAMS